MIEAIKETLEADLEVDNKKGGYIRKIGHDKYRHQTCYRSTDDYNNVEEAIEAFLQEHKS